MKNKTAIIAAGEIHDYPAAAAKLADCNYLIACDGGARHFAPMGAVPDILIGDFDSAPSAVIAAYQAQGISVLSFPAEKDDTDLALAVAHALERAPASVLILGAMGGRFDHALANLHALAQICAHSGDTAAEIWDENTSVRLVYPASCGDTPLREGDVFFPFPREAYKTITLLPLGNCVTGITTRGLQYPLRNETLRTGETRGISNTFTADTAEISVKSGLLLVIRSK